MIILNTSEKWKKLKISIGYEGFSIIEMITVIAIIGVLSAISIPKYVETVQTMRLMNAGDKIRDDLRLIYNQSIVQHDTTWFVADLNTNSYGIYEGATQGSRVLILDPSTNSQNPVDFDETFPGIALTNVNFNGNTEFMYDWWGTPSSGGVIELDNSLTITVVSETGYVHK
ncbi:MAG: prepilin-type N-terminal cleavage/methylation domain-containing protein [Candidatus Marinimicrobia bacterium]|nr:prepilin-type N-terminal cleavage/methylation domain-containing protein [Candidatus Neomarinimicrobiota bacterium]